MYFRYIREEFKTLGEAIRKECLKYPYCINCPIKGIISKCAIQAGSPDEYELLEKKDEILKALYLDEY